MTKRRTRWYDLTAIVVSAMLLPSVIGCVTIESRATPPPEPVAEQMYTCSRTRDSDKVFIGEGGRVSSLTETDTVRVPESDVHVYRASDDWDCSAEPDRHAIGDGASSQRGVGDEKTWPSMLDAGDYEVTILMRGDCIGGRWSLWREDDDTEVASLKESGIVSGVESGRHYWQVFADDDCIWTVALDPLGG